MDHNAIRYIVEYTEEEGIPIQLTRSADGTWTADFIHKIHAKVCMEELLREGHKVGPPNTASYAFTRLI